MDRKAVARQTLEILKRGSYEQGGRTVELAAVHKRSVEGSRLFTPEEGERILRSVEGRQVQQIPTWGYKNCSTVDAVLEFARRGDRRAEFCQRQESGRRVLKRGHGPGGEPGSFQRPV